MSDRNFDKKDVISELLQGMTLDGFTFHTHFVLTFSRIRSGFFDGKELPQTINLTIVTDWWFGVKEKWEEKVNKFTKEINLVEPDEPVLAFELAVLRWSDDSEITSVDLDSNILKINFKCDKSISISNYDDMDMAWEIRESYPNNNWSVVCEDGQYHINYPH